MNSLCMELHVAKSYKRYNFLTENKCHYTYTLLHWKLKETQAILTVVRCTGYCTNTGNTKHVLNSLTLNEPKISLKISPSHRVIKSVEPCPSKQ